MFKWLKNFFLPTKENDHQPFLLTGKTLWIIFSVVLFLEIILIFQVFVIFRETDFLAQVLPGALVSLTNESRKAHNVSELKINPLLEEAAELKSRDMAEKNYFAHVSPDGVTPWHWLSEVGYEYTVAGENLAVNFFDSKQLAQAWMDSPSHRSNILDQRFTEIGIGLAQGVYQGRPTVFVTQFFGAPRETVDLIAFEDLEEPDPIPAPEPEPTPETTPPVETEPETDPEVSGDLSGDDAEETEEAEDIREETFDDETGTEEGDEEDLEEIEEERGETFVAFQRTPSAGGSGIVMGTTAVAETLTSPKTEINRVLGIVFGALLIIFFLAVFINIHIQKPLMLSKAVLVIALVGGLITFNSLLFGNIELPENMSGTTDEGPGEIEEKTLIF